jgi:signal transduction histidine kinase/putative methionine-R-sulfoxide reductase with GAF domain
LPTLLQQDRARLALLGVQLFVPLPAQHQLAGWLALGPRNSGEPYASRDLGFLESLCDQAGLAIERAQVVVNLERRVHEMDALTRVAQGINITQAFDDILELIYTQASLVIQFKDFRVALTKPSGTLYYAFYLENDERLVDRENVSIQTGHALEEAIIESNRPILTDDYERECRNRGLLPGSAWLYSWMGVPLQTRSETFGAISLGSRDPALYYSDQQRSLLQAIADQAAGAIVKARLLQESEQRARQLSTLNDIGRSLTSTLELRPLLDQILSSAVEILNCQAGSLFLIDDQTGELIFEVTVGPVAGDLVGQRLPPGTGIVGKSANSGLPIIANDVRQKMEWFQKPDEKTGFITRDLLVVPLQVKERVIGVIEVINKIDGSRFITQDQDLLATFASQAAVAIENARLYTQTDAALSARVEELSVMQRIDRELNASLDLERALRITLEWSLRQANSDAGLVGLFTHGENGSGPGLRVMASHGYPAEIMQQPLLSKTPGITAAFNEGQVQYYKANPITDEPKHTLHALLEDASFQVVVPIRRKSDVIGALLLEARNNKQILPETLNFLSRLSDHAAIAVTNGQLYAEVQAANLAKSEFVSLVSHELKTPMTSIRGYADLLAQGAVGPVNEAQANFLGTIRANVNRMATLVSDLADVSRIEAGRLRLEFSVVNLGDIIQESIRSAKAQADEKQQTLQLEMPQDLPKVWGDPNRLMQIFGNLISNAIKYTPLAGLITIQITPAANRWDVTGAPEVVLVDIADTGYGIAIEDQKKIFLKFFRSEDQNIRTAPGTGLGLNITRHLVEMQGGRIWFVSEPGKGTTFSFTVPISAT